MSRQIKPIKIPMYMNGARISTLESLQENFDLQKVLEYFVSGDLLKWLDGRYYDEEAEKVRNLSKDDANLGKKICRIFGVEYTEDAEVDLPNERLIEKTNALKKLTTDEKIISHAAQTAFTQEDLAYLLDEEDAKTIYLCGEKFSIPANFENRKYIGIFSKPEIKISIRTLEELKAREINFENVNLPKNLVPPPAPKEITIGYAVITNFYQKFGTTYDHYYQETDFLGYCNALLVRGKITLDARVRVFRDNKKIHDGTIFALVSKKTKFVDNLDDTEFDRSFDIHFDKVRPFEKGDRIEFYVQDTQELAEGIDLTNIEKFVGCGRIRSPKYGGHSMNIVYGVSSSRARIFRKGQEIYSGEVRFDDYSSDVIEYAGGVGLKKDDLVEFYSE